MTELARLAEENRIMRQALCYYATKLHISKPMQQITDRQVYAGGSFEIECTFSIPYEDGSVARKALTALGARETEEPGEKR